MIDRVQDEWRALVARLRALPRETEWVEFKVNNKDPETCMLLLTDEQGFSTGSFVDFYARITHGLCRSALFFIEKSITSIFSKSPLKTVQSRKDQ